MGRPLALLCVLALAASGAEKKPVARRGLIRKPEFRRGLIGKGAVARSAAAAGIQHLRNSPREWGDGPIGYVKRFGSAIGTHAAKHAIQFGVAAAHNENLTYQRSNRHGALPRLKYAVKHTFIVPRRTKSGRTVALGRISGSMGAGMLSQAWRPAAGVGAGLSTFGVAIGLDVGANVAREFWPRRHNRRPR